MKNDKRCLIIHAMKRQPYWPTALCRCLLPFDHLGDCKIEFENKRFSVSPKGFYDHPPIEEMNA
jgi:hypothetical protein